jgi:hypothetical protein
MLHFIFPAENDGLLHNLQSKFQQGLMENEYTQARLKVTELYSYGDNFFDPLPLTKSLVDLAFIHRYPNAKSLMLTHQQLFQNLFADVDDGLSICFNSDERAFYLNYRGLEYKAIHYISCLGDWAAEFNHIRTPHGLQIVHQKLTSTGCRIFAGIVPAPLDAEKFMCVINLILTQLDNPGKILHKAALGGELDNLLAGWNETVREFLTTFIGYHYHCLNLNFSQVEKLQQLIDWNLEQLTNFLSMCESMIKLHAPLKEI